jgi:dynein heavy chain
MSNEIIIGNWTNKYMLPNDSYSVDNAIIMENSNRFCIMIDP